MTDFYSRFDTDLQGDVYSIPFSYIKEEEIFVFINDEVFTDWYFLNKTQIKLNTIPSDLAQDAQISIRRITDIKNKIVTYTNNTLLNKENLNSSQDQLLHAVQEIYDNNIQFEEDTLKIIEKNKEEVLDIQQNFEDEVNEMLEEVSEAADKLHQLDDILARAEEAAESAETDATLASDKANLAVQEADKATSQANLTQQYKQETIDYVENAYNVIDTSVTDGVDNINRTTEESIDRIFSTLQGAAMPIGYHYSLNCTADYIPSGSLPRDGAEYSSKQFQGLWDNYLTGESEGELHQSLKMNEFCQFKNGVLYNNDTDNTALFTVPINELNSNVKDGFVIEVHTLEDVVTRQNLLTALRGDGSSQGTFLYISNKQIIGNNTNPISIYNTFYLKISYHAEDRWYFYFSYNKEDWTLLISVATDSTDPYTTISHFVLQLGGNEGFKGLINLQNSYFMKDSKTIPFVNKKISSLLPTQSYAEYDNTINTYMYNDKFAVKQAFNISTTNNNLNINANDFTVPITLENRNKECENVVLSNLWGNNLTKNTDNTFELSVTSGDFSWDIGDDRQIYLFDIKLLGEASINLRDCSIPIDVYSKGDGRCYLYIYKDSLSTIDSTYPLYVHLEAVSLSGGASSLSSRYFYIQDANGNTIFTHTYSIKDSSNYNNYSIDAYKIDGFESSIYERKDEIKEPLVRVETITCPTWYANSEETNPCFYGLQIEGTPQEGDIITVSSDGGTFKVPTAKQIDRYLIAKKEPTEIDKTWYNLYSDGWIEQGGTVISGDVSSYIVTYPIQMKDLSYTALIAPFIGASDDTGADDNVYAILSGNVSGSYPYAKSTTQLRISTLSKANAGFNWRVEGYVDLEQYSIPRQFVVVANGSINQSQMDWAEWASALQGKANKDGSNWNSSLKQIDGQWNVSIAQILSSSGTLSHVTYDLSDYLPKDNYDYTVRFKLAGYDNDSTYGYYLDTDLWQTSSTSITSDDGISSLAYHIYGGTYARQSISIIDLPVGKARYVSVTGMGGDNVYLTVLGYKRIGTNR